MFLNIFSIKEFKEDKVVCLSYYAILLTYLVSFLNLSFRSFSSLGTIYSYLHNQYICPPYFKSCGEYYFLESLPYGFSYTVLYIFFLILIFLGFYFAYKKEWQEAWICLFVLFVWKFLISFIFSYGAGNYDYYDLVFSFIILFLPYKSYFLRRAFVLLYFLAATVKFIGGWIAGTHFTSLVSGLPFIPDSLAPVATNIVIIFQMIECWLLLSKNKYLQTISFSFAVFFHIYSGFLVGYRYLISDIPILFILFFGYHSISKSENDIKYNYKKLIVGYLFLLFLIIMQIFASNPLESDRHYTLERNKFGLYMFEGNHQCVSFVKIYKATSSIENVYENSNARNRCDPYNYWFTINNLCEKDKDIKRIEWKFDHSVNGEPFYRIIDEDNACSIEYSFLKSNKWIKDKKDSELIAYPLKNFYY